ncbi:DinB family protein [Paenibacillus hodogayensis]|uniref:DinB family protein n=1 Tax=Paenibacillus hodogayensis TaxID=279208 RepID=A0ABV5W0J4_9BACL
MYTTISSFIDDYRQESTSTQKLLDLLTDDSLRLEVAPGYRKLGDLAWHLVTAGGILEPTGLEFDAPNSRSESPPTAAAIAETYRISVESLLQAVKAQWTDETLRQTIDVFGQQWQVGKTMAMFVKHEIHHRGQLTVLMRQAGLPVTGVYGPSKEEWAAMGVPSPT